MVKRNKSNAYEPKDSFLPHALCSFPFVKWCIFSVSFENCSKRGSTLKVSQVSTGFKVFSRKQKRFTQNNRCVSDGAARIPFPSASFISQPGSSDTPRRFQMQSWQQVLWHMQQAEKICCHLQRGGGSRGVTAASETHLLHSILNTACVRVVVKAKFVLWWWFQNGPFSHQVRNHHVSLEKINMFTLLTC